MRAADGYWDMSPFVSGAMNTAPDDETFQHLARAYASKNPDMAASTEFKEGITNGAAWYPLYGGTLPKP
jgi:carboxypeptidase D